MEKAMAMMRGNESCGEQNTCKRNTENLETSCAPAPKSPKWDFEACDEGCAEDTNGVNSSNDNCGETETTCVCICCFQYAAPVNTITEYKFDLSSPSITGHIFIVGHIKDPHIGAPWQPPDLV